MLCDEPKSVKIAYTNNRVCTHRQSCSREGNFQASSTHSHGIGIYLNYELDVDGYRMHLFKMYISSLLPVHVLYMYSHVSLYMSYFYHATNSIRRRL